MSKKSPEYYKNHRKLYAARGKASEYICDRCREAYAQSWAQKHNTDGSKPKHYRPMCWTCHQAYDKHWSEERRARVGAAAKKRWRDDKYKEKVGAAISISKMGHEVSEATRKKISKANKGNSFASGKRTPEQCARIKAGRWGGDGKI